MSWHFLQEQEEVSWEGTCLDGAPSALLSLLPTHGVYSSQGSATECYLDSQSGMTFAPLTGSRGGEGLMLLVGDSPAKTLAQPEPEKDSTANEADYGQKWRGLFAKYSRDTHLWRTAQCSLFEDLEQSLEIWPRWGSMRNGECYQRKIWERRTEGNASGLWLPTPTATDYKRTPMKKQYANRPQTEGCPDDLAKWAVRDSGLDHARLVPDLWEWVMGWPLMWTELRPQEMGKFQSWQQQHGVF